jgi:hypothetical protein
MNPLAQELNAVLSDSPVAGLLSPLGSRMYFPKGIIAQSAEAKKMAHLANATIGMAVKGGKALALSAVKEAFAGLDVHKAVVYAPTAGDEVVRASWLEAMIRKIRRLKKRMSPCRSSFQALPPESTTWPICFWVKTIASSPVTPAGTTMPCRPRPSRCGSSGSTLFPRGL